MNRKMSIKGIFYIAGIFAVIFCVSCPNLMSPPYGESGMAFVSVSVLDTQMRTVFPLVDLSDIAMYRLYGGINGAAETQLAEITTGLTIISLTPGIWNFTLNAYNSNGDLVLQGTVAGQTISLNGSNQIAFNLFPLDSGTGAVHITINFPNDTGVTRINVSGDVDPAEYAITPGGGSFVFSKTGIASGDYFISFKLFRGDTPAAVVSELVQVRSKLTSAKVITLAGHDLKPINQPGIEVPQGGAIIYINSQTGLENIRSHIDDSSFNYGKNAYILENDITLSGTWEPIGYVESVDNNGHLTGGIHAFSGNFYGNGKTIYNLVLPGGAIHYIGLFGYIEDALIQDFQVELGMNTITITNSSAQHIGVVAGKFTNSVFKNIGVYSNSDFIVSGGSGRAVSVGGIASAEQYPNYNSIIEKCYVSMNITVTYGGTHIHASGIANEAAIIKNCYYLGTISGTGVFADLSGISVVEENTTKVNSYSAGRIMNNASDSIYTSTSGIARDGIINNNVSLMERIDLAYSTSQFARINARPENATLSSNYAFSGMLLNGFPVSDSDPDSEHGLDKTAAELKQRSTYETGLGWDFNNVWEMGPPSYPFPIFKWQNGNVKLPPGFWVIDDNAPFYVSNPSEFASALSAIRSSSESSFTIISTADMSLAPQDLALSAYENKTITLMGNSSSRKIDLSNQGSLFTVGSDVELILKDIILEGRSDNDASLVTVDGGKLVLNNGGKITGNTYNTAVRETGGGGIFVDGGTLIITGGEVSGNEVNGTVAEVAGGGIFAVNYGSVQMVNGTIKNNMVTSVYYGDGNIYGGGIALYDNSTFEMLNGTIEGNINTGRSVNMGISAAGGGVAIWGNASFYLKGGKIRNNSCYGEPGSGWGGGTGGGVSKEMYGGNFHMTGGVISGNSVASSVNPNVVFSDLYTLGAYGGGVKFQIHGGGSFTKTGGIIYGNDVEGNDTDGYPLKNTAQFDSEDFGGGHAVFYENGLTISEKLWRNNTAYETDNMSTNVSGPAGGWEIEKIFFSDSSEFSDALIIVQNSPSVRKVTLIATDDVSLGPQDLTLSAYENKTILLKGDSHTINLSGNGSLFTVGENVELILEDIILEGISNNDASLVTVDGGKLVMNSGVKITENVITVAPFTKAGGVTIRNGAQFTMNDGEISGNTAIYSDNEGVGGLYVSNNSLFTMNGGKISDNTATSDYSATMVGGVIITVDSKFVMNDGEISDNKHLYTWFNTIGAGGVYIYENSLFEMYGGKITHNFYTGNSGTRGRAAGGVLVQGFDTGNEGISTFLMHGGEISANVTDHYFSAGGVFISFENNPGIFFKDGGTIYGSDEPETGLRNTTGRVNGAAIYGMDNVFGAGPKSRNASLYENDDFDSTKLGAAAGWEEW